MTHALACGLTQCGGHTLTAEGWLVMFMIICAVGAIGAFIKEQDAKLCKRRGLPPRTPRQPADISPFTAGLLAGQRQSSYKPTAMYATTPSGVKVRVRCPHRSGHRTSDLAASSPGPTPDLDALRAEFRQAIQDDLDCTLEAKLRRRYPPPLAPPQPGTAIPG